MPLAKSFIDSRKLFFFGLLLVIVGLPLSSFLMSVGQFILLGNWILEAGFQQKFEIIKTSKLLWIMSSFYLIHLFGLFYTTDFDYALTDLRVKLPLLWFPLLFTSSKPIEKKELSALLNVFILAVFVASIISIIVLMGWTKRKVVDIRDISIFTSHIRFALMIVFCVGILINDYFKPSTWLIYVIKAIIIAWFIVFLTIMESITGLFILLSVFLLMALSFLIKTNGGYLRFVPFLLFGILISYFSFLIRSEWKLFYTKPIALDFTQIINKKTAKGKYYFHDTTATAIENGTYVWVYCATDELETAWNLRSNIDFHGKDKKGNSLAHTLVQFIASKGLLKKDSLAVAQLSDKEINSIENGISNWRYADIGNLRSRIHQLIVEYNNYSKGGNPSGHSLLMRFEFWKSGLQIIKNNLFFGVGTGDVQVAYRDVYKNENTPLSKEWQLRSHNQFLAITISFGLIGLLLFLIWIFYPIYLLKNRYRVFYIFLIIVLLSMLSEDTLETQAGATFYGFFYCLLLQRKNGETCSS